MMLPVPDRSYTWRFVHLYAFCGWDQVFFFVPPIWMGFCLAKAAHSPCGCGPWCAASIAGGLVLPVLRYAQARSMYAPLEMTDSVDSCWQALNMHTHTHTYTQELTHAHSRAQTSTVCLAHTNSGREMTGPPAPLKWRPSSLAGLAGTLVYVTDYIQWWTESLWRQQLFSQSVPRLVVRPILKPDDSIFGCGLGVGGEHWL